MRRLILPLLAGIFFLVFQTTFLSFLPTQWVRPDVLLILTLYLAFLFPPILGGVLAFFLGYLMDLFSGNTLGLYTFSRPLVFFAAQLLREQFYLEGFGFQFLFTFLFSLSEGILISVLINALLSIPLGSFYPSFFACLFSQAFFTGLVTPLLFFLFRKGSPLLSRPPEQRIGERGYQL